MLDAPELFNSWTMDAVSEDALVSLQALQACLERRRDAAAADAHRDRCPKAFRCVVVGNHDFELCAVQQR